MNFDFLKQVEVNQEVAAKATRATAPKLPEGMRLRVFASGKVYPSKELVEAYALEYTNKEIKGGNGFDIFKSSEWAGFPTDAPETYLFIAAAPKAAPKVSLFNSCGYNEDGTPKVSVLEQGGGSFGKELVEMVKEVFGVEIEKGSYVDLEINTEIAIPSNTGVYYLPKVSKKKDGTIVPDAVRRENIVINPLTVLGAEATTEETVEESTTVEGDVNAAEIEESVEEAVVDATPETPVNPFATPPTSEAAAAAPSMPEMPQMPETPSV